MIAVARKVAVILHHMWMDGMVFRYCQVIAPFTITTSTMPSAGRVGVS